MPRLERVQTVPRPLDEVFAFFAQPLNLEALTPAFLQFRILTPPPIVMAVGLQIDYQLKLYGIPLRWTSVIDEFVPGERFVDRQIRGPYRRWHHTHTFEAVREGTRVTDVVEYEMPWSILGSFAHVLFVRRSLAKIFDYRRTKIEELFGAS